MAEFKEETVAGKSLESIEGESDEAFWKINNK